MNETHALLKKLRPSGWFTKTRINGCRLRSRKRHGATCEGKNGAPTSRVIN